MKDGNTHEQVTTYTYDSSGRLGTVADATDTFTYGYLLESNLVETLTSPAHTVTNTYETSRNVLDTKKNEVGSTLVSGYDYTVNALGQRTDLSQTGTAFATARSIAWGYDSLGQATKADSSIPGLDRSYQYDMIGNRLKSANNLTLPANNNYTVNVLNQYTAVDSNSPSYDDDGNATAYPLPAHLTANSTLVWDAENRLTGATVSGIATSYVYDSQGRRIATVTGATTTHTIYDGWNPITKYSGATLDEAYLWGMDLSGSMQGAGGVAGLLSVNDGNASYYPTYDGNGNVSEYLDSAGSVQAHYEYDPFGKTTVATGTKAQDFAHRFSTKPLDTETGLYYYGYRYYDPVTGRWPSRDPIGEQGGVNLYGFVGNDGVNWVDILGLTVDCCDWPEATMKWLEDNCKHIKEFAKDDGIEARDLANALAEENSRHGAKDGVQDAVSDYSSTLADQITSAVSKNSDEGPRRSDVGPANINMDSAESVRGKGEFINNPNGWEQGLADYLKTGRGTADYGSRLMKIAVDKIDPHLKNVLDPYEKSAMRTNAWREDIDA